MGGFFLRPKDTNLDKTNKHINAEAVGVVAEFEAEYTDKTGVANHFRDPIRREAPKNFPLPTGGRSAGISSPGVRGWRGPVSRTVPSGFGRGNRAGRRS